MLTGIKMKKSHASLLLATMVAIPFATVSGAQPSSTHRIVVDHGHHILPPPSGKIATRYLTQTVAYRSPYPEGTIVIDVDNRFLYLVRQASQAIRYGVSVGSAAFAWSGEAIVGKKVVWPRWTPTSEMLARDRRLMAYREGVAPGPTNPLGARALYLYRDGVDTLYRIHGTSEYWSIGKAASSGCIRIMNNDILELFDRIPLGTRVIVLPHKSPMKWRRR